MRNKKITFPSFNLTTVILTNGEILFGAGSGVEVQCCQTRSSKLETGDLKNVLTRVTGNNDFQRKCIVKNLSQSF